MTGKGYIIPALGPLVFAFENEMRKHRFSRAKSKGTRGNDKSRRNERYPRKRGRRSFDPSLTGPFFASFSPITRIPRSSAQIIVFHQWGPHENETPTLSASTLGTALAFAIPFMLVPLSTTPVSVVTQY